MTVVRVSFVNFLYYGATVFEIVFFCYGRRSLASDRVSEALSPGPQGQTPASVSQGLPK